MWKWHYDYLGENIRFMSQLKIPLDSPLKRNDVYHNKDKKDKYYLRDVDKPVVVPIKKKIRFLTTANDVQHSWFVPELGIKKDAIPGFINETWAYIDEPGTYRGQCAELCGTYHGYMPIVVIAKPDDEYQTWLAEQKSNSKGA